MANVVQRKVCVASEAFVVGVDNWNESNDDFIAVVSRLAAKLSFNVSMPFAERSIKYFWDLF
jgi:hypothetical protein